MTTRCQLFYVEYKDRWKSHALSLISLIICSEKRKLLV